MHVAMVIVAATEQGECSLRLLWCTVGNECARLYSLYVICSLEMNESCWCVFVSLFPPDQIQSVFHVSIPRHQVVDAQEALLTLEPFSPYPSKAELRHPVTYKSFYSIELWKVVSLGYRLDVAQLWIETLPMSVKSRDNTMITLLCRNVIQASTSLCQAILPHLQADEQLREETANQLVTIRKCWNKPATELGECSVVAPVPFHLQLKISIGAMSMSQVL